MLTTSPPSSRTVLCSPPTDTPAQYTTPVCRGCFSFPPALHTILPPAAATTRPSHPITSTTVTATIATTGRRRWPKSTARRQPHLRLAWCVPPNTTCPVSHCTRTAPGMHHSFPLFSSPSLYPALVEVTPALCQLILHLSRHTALYSITFLRTIPLHIQYIPYST